MDKNDLKSSADKITPNQAQKQKMLKIILESRKRIAPVKRTTKRFALIAAVIAVCVLTATTALAISLGWDEKLIEYLKPSEKQMETLSGAVGTPEATLTKNSVTITVKQTLADSYGIYVLYEMTVPKDMTLNDGVTWEFSHLDAPMVKPDKGYTFGTQSTEILEQTANKRTALIYLQRTAPSENGYLELEFLNLGYYPDIQPPTENVGTIRTKFVPLVEGKWDLKWEFNFADTSKTIEVNKPLSINGSKDTVTRLVISPMSLCVLVRGDDIVGSARPVVNFKDGSQLTYDDVGLGNKSFGYYLIDEDNMIYENQLFYRFKSIINLEDVESVTIGDVTIPV
ncbi:protein of unknown function [Sporobacter termitidis DSM 10068]|uniref:Uncharacterized protein n=1 Tax=Sporobacter termitidis DSM 10068 TaxID=1123282 RepID=A0A1M5XT15_9FIRM|nr:DUF4179 domain-containing protein [Sporobacter termitidis]SHI02951.1 protein of unknown function [Sporobacter termitidis DSM 10068]